MGAHPKQLGGGGGGCAVATALHAGTGGGLEAHPHPAAGLGRGSHPSPLPGLLGGGGSPQRSLCQRGCHGNGRQPALCAVAVTAAFAVDIGKWGGTYTHNTTPSCTPPGQQTPPPPPPIPQPCSKHPAPTWALLRLNLAKNPHIWGFSYNFWPSFAHQWGPFLCGPPPPPPRSQHCPRRYLLLKALARGGSSLVPAHTSVRPCWATGTQGPWGRGWQLPQPPQPCPARGLVVMDAPPSPTGQTLGGRVRGTSSSGGSGGTQAAPPRGSAQHRGFANNAPGAAAPRCRISHPGDPEILPQPQVGQGSA